MAASDYNISLAKNYWTARNPNRNTTTHIVVHHAAWTYAPGDAIRAIWRYHKTRWPGYDGIGYHLVAQRDDDGSIGLYQTNPLEMVGVGVYNKNATTVHLCLAHDFTNDIPGDEWMDAAIRGVRYLKAHYPDAEIVGHKELAVAGWETSCPGTRWREWKPRLLAAVSDDPAPTAEPDDIQVIGVQQVLQRRAFVALCRDREFGLSDDEADRLYTMCADWHIDARFVAAIALVEHNNYPMRSDLFVHTRNPGNMRRRDPMMAAVKHEGREFITFEAAYQGFAFLVFWLKYFYGWRERLTTVAAINEVYAPEEDDNVPPTQRTARMLVDMRAMLERNQ